MNQNYCKLLKGSFVIMLILSPYMGNSQTSGSLVDRSSNFPKITTPNVAAFNKYIDNPISLYSGSVAVNIPLYTLKDGAIELPISLSYNTSGIKVEEEASSVGLGWNLNVGGVITQYCVGGYDGNDTKFPQLLNCLEFDPFAIPGYYHYRHIDDVTYQNGFGSIATSPHYTTKLNPDVFYFSYPGGSGKFFIDYRDDTIHLVNREKGLKISTDIYNGKKAFIITTEEGIEHSYEFFSETYDQYNTTNRTSLSYVLRSTRYPNNQMVNYEYQKYPVFRRTLSEIYVANINPGETELARHSGIAPHGKFNSSSEQHIRGDDFFISRILTSNYIVDFRLTNRIDIVNAKKIDEISIRSSSSYSPIKKYKLVYDYFTSNNQIMTWENGGPNRVVPATSDASTNRLKLLSVHELSLENEINNRYEFTYNETKLPPKHSFAVDYWGNSNLSTKKTYMPQFEYLLWNRPERETIVNHFTELVYNPDLNITKVGDRAYDFEACQAAILTGIRFPTGGYQEFIYEPNSFIRHLIPTKSQTDEIKSSTVRVSHIHMQESVPFTLDKRTTINLQMEIIRGLNRWQDMVGSCASVFLPNGGENVTDDLVLSYIAPDESENVIIYRSKEFILDPGVYYFNGNIPYGLGNQDGPNGKHGSVNTTISYGEPVFQETDEVEVQGCGVRIKSINNYNRKGENSPAKTINYEYIIPYPKICSGILHQDLRFHKEFNNHYLLCKDIEYFDDASPGTTYYYTLLPQIALFSENVQSNPYSTQSPVGYSSVKETVNDGSNGYVWYYFHNERPQFEQHSVRYDDALNGKLLKKETYKNNTSIVVTEEYEYEKVTSHEYGGITVIDPYSKYPEVFINGSFHFPIKCFPSQFLQYHSRLMLLTHRLNSYNITLKRKMNVLDNVIEMEEYTYNPATLQLKEKTTYTSQHDILKKKYFYANDHSSYIHSEMQSKNMLNSIVEERIFNNDEFIGGIFTEYNSFNSIIAPSKKYFSEISSPLSNKIGTVLDRSIYPQANIEYKVYDKYGNPVYMIHNEVTHIVYLWGYKGQYPIAEIKNATYDQVASAIGCRPELISDNPSTYEALFQRLYNDQNHLQSTFITTYKYDPLIGLIQMIDPQRNSLNYEYDLFGRLIRIINNEGEILNEFNYHLRE